MTGAPKDQAASIHQRLLNGARERGEDFQLTLLRYGAERLLYRLCRSPYSERFVLKGALLLLLWPDQLYRPTRDVDLEGYGDATPEHLREVSESSADSHAPKTPCASTRTRSRPRRSAPPRSTAASASHSRLGSAAPGSASRSTSASATRSRRVRESRTSRPFCPCLRRASSRTRSKPSSPRSSKRSSGSAGPTAA